MKEGSDNFRQSAIQELMTRLNEHGVKTIIYEPMLGTPTFLNSEKISTVQEFKKISDIILANRMTDDLHDVTDKVFTRDLYNEN